MGGFIIGFLNLAIFIAGILLIGLILIQKGKGGGLAGAFGGAGGSSAFGSRAGDAFTRGTIYLAAVWLVMIMIQIKLVQPGRANAAVPEMAAEQDLLNKAMEAAKKADAPKDQPKPVESKDDKDPESKDKDAKDKADKDKEAKDKKAS